MRRIAGTLVALSILVFAGVAEADWNSLETKNLRLVYYDPVHTFVTPHVGRSFESAMDFYTEFFGYEPSERVTVRLMDISDSGGGSAGALPTNNLTLGIAPLSFTFETMPPGERMTTIMNHELLHLVSMDQATGSDVKARRFFRGKVLPTPDHPETLAYLYMTTPRIGVPSWYQEGGAVFMETWMAGGLGRAQGAFDEMVFRAMVKDDSRFYSPLGLVAEGVKIDFQGPINSYLYGTRFMSYLALEYSPEEVASWHVRTEGTKKYYAKQFEQTFGRPIREVWDEWIEWEQEFQQKSLETIRQYPITPTDDISDRALGSVSRAFFDPETREIYAAFNYPGQVAHVGRISIDDGSVEKIVDVKAPVIYSVTSLVYEPESKKIFFTTDNSAYRDLRVVDAQGGKARRLIKDARIGDLALNRADRSIWGVRHFNGYTTLVRIPPPYTDWYQVHTFPYGEVIYDIDVSPDGTKLATSFAKINGRHTVRVYSIDSFDSLGEGSKPEPVNELDLGGTIPNNFVFSPDGRYLYGSSYYTGVSNIFRYELANEALEGVSNTETGLFRPIPLGDDKLIVFRFTGEGLVPTTIDAQPLEDVAAITFLGRQVEQKHPTIRGWLPTKPKDIPLDSRIERDDAYQPWKTLGLESIYPVIEGYKDSGALGFAANFSDPMFFNRFSLTASYSPDRDLAAEERTHVHFRWYRRNWEANLKWNDADFYDLFGPTKVSRKGYSAGLKYNKILLYDLPRQLDLNVESTYYGNMDQLPRYQNVEVEIDRLLEGAVQLTYTNQRASMGAVDYEKGVKAELIAGATYVDSDLIPGAVANFDFGFALPLKNSSIWVRSSMGANSGDIDDPFANFFFGGFGNNWVDHGTSKQYRQFFSFPGVELNEIPGRNYAKTMLEWNLPPLRFRQVGTPGLFLTWARASLFAGGIRTNFDQDYTDRTIGNAGAQVDFRFTVMSKFKMTLSLGYAVAFENVPDSKQPERSKNEFMFSLNVLN